MARPITQSQPERRFVASVTTSLRIYAPTREWAVWNYESFEENPFHPTIAAKVIGLAFLNVVTGWEEYMEDSFVRYMCGATSGSTPPPALRLGPCRNRAHARSVLAASKAGGFLRWHDFRWVQRLAGLFFVEGRPYSAVPEIVVDRLSDAVTIRNRIAHASSVARRDFRRVVNTLRGRPVDSPLPPGMSPGTLLVSPAGHGFPVDWLNEQSLHYGDIFEAYMNLFLEQVSILTPSGNCCQAP